MFLSREYIATYNCSGTDPELNLCLVLVDIISCVVGAAVFLLARPTQSTCKKKIKQD